MNYTNGDKQVIEITICEKNGNIIVTDIDCLDLELTLDCGQAFRWVKNAENDWSGVAGGHYLNIVKSDNELIFKNTTKDIFDSFWSNYFDIDKDYKKICETLSNDELVAGAIKEYYGIRILNQEPWEALCSFVISQQNNIKRIKQIIDRLCKKYGDEIADGFYTFPSAEVLAEHTAEDFADLGLGYRAKYIEALAKGVAGGDIDLDYIASLPTDEARNELKKIHGVGNKVANCAMLFGMKFYDCVPIDTWINKALKYYPEGLPECFKGYEGIAQQYLFHWARNNL